MALLEVEQLLRFTTNDIPRYAEEPLVMMGAVLAAPDFDRPSDGSMLTLGIKMIASAVNLRTTSTVQADYF